MNSSYVKRILFSDIESFTKKTQFSKHIETGKGGVGGNSTRLEPAHMVKPFDKNRCV
jgi:hypothetical protein